MEHGGMCREENLPVFSERKGVPHPAALLSLMRNAPELRVVVEHTSLLPPSFFPPSLPPALFLPGLPLTVSLFLKNK